jgi:hypothetical protein
MLIREQVGSGRLQRRTEIHGCLEPGPLREERRRIQRVENDRRNRHDGNRDKNTRESDLVESGRSGDSALASHFSIIVVHLDTKLTLIPSHQKHIAIIGSCNREEWNKLATPEKIKFCDVSKNKVRRVRTSCKMVRDFSERKVALLKPALNPTAAPQETATAAE